jgi:AraC-like DNA-binding protein
MMQDRAGSEQQIPSGDGSRPEGVIESVDALRQLIAELLPDIRPTIKRVAPRLGMSTRTMQRRLYEWGHSFEQIVDETRRDLAIARLTSGNESITEIAFGLGYSDLAHFTRAFRRWTGEAPREFVASRRRQGAKP